MVMLRDELMAEVGGGMEEDREAAAVAIPAPVAEGTAQSDSSSFVFGAQILINFGESGLLENEPRYPQSRHTILF